MTALLRSPAEIGFRIRQELVNLRQWVRPPKASFTAGFAPRSLTPDASEIAAVLAGTAFEKEVIRLAADIRRHRFPLLGLTLETGPEIRWRRDYPRGIETGLGYFRLIPYLDAERAGDHKVICELNRHQHLVTLAQAYLFTGDVANIQEISAQLECWFAQNPFARGINWASALEVAFRALSWMWVYQLAGPKLPASLRTKLLQEIYCHGCFLENNLSFYFSPNTHLLGEALTLHALGLFFAPLARAAEWERLGAQVMREQMDRQISQDGSHFEQSTYYHVYALDMFLLHAILARPDGWYMERLRCMARYLHSVLGPARALPFLGDDDGGRLFHPYGPRERFGRATMATASLVLHEPAWEWDAEDLNSQAVWWLGADVFQQNPRVGSWKSELFRNSAMVMVSGENQVIVKTAGFGPRNAGHSHSDVLSIVARSGDEEILIDPGTYAYVGEPHWRDWFRGLEAHNCVRIDGLDQATAAGPFHWAKLPQVNIISSETSDERDVVEAECRYAGFAHRRRVEFQKPDLVVVADEINGPPGEHSVEQLWHLGSPDARACLFLSDEAETSESWRSSVFGEKHPATMVRVLRKGVLPIRLEARISLRQPKKVEDHMRSSSNLFATISQE
jgi:heparinase II/III-like protein